MKSSSPVRDAKKRDIFIIKETLKMSLLDALLEKPEHAGWVKEARSAVGHPDDSDLADAKEWALHMVGMSQAI